MNIGATVYYICRVQYSCITFITRNNNKEKNKWIPRTDKRRERAYKYSAPTKGPSLSFIRTSIRNIVLLLLLLLLYYYALLKYETHFVARVHWWRRRPWIETFSPEVDQFRTVHTRNVAPRTIIMSIQYYYCAAHYHVALCCINNVQLFSFVRTITKIVDLKRRIWHMQTANTNVEHAICAGYYINRSL